MQQRTKFYLFLFISVLTSSVTLLSQSVSVKTVTESTLSLKIDNPKSISCLIAIREKASKPITPQLKIKYISDNTIYGNNKLSMTGDGNFIVYTGSVTQDIPIKGLKPGIIYVADLYRNFKTEVSSKPYKSLDIALLAKEPKTQAKITAFSGIKSDEITIHFKWGDGKSRVIIVSEAKECELPKDGMIYAASNLFGKGSLTAKSSYVVLDDSAVAKSVTVNGLKPATQYYAIICEANGSGVQKNYNTNIPKQGFTYTLVEPPVALEAADISGSSFLAKWKGSDASTKYLIEVATDENFTMKVEEYKSVDVGKIESILIEDLPKSDFFYYRLQAIGPNGKESMYSNVMKVIVKNK